jgi:antitoxin HicB
MMDSAYPVALRQEEGEIVATSRDLPELLTFGANTAEALASAEDALVVVVLSYVEKGLDLPEPSPLRKGEHLVHLPAPVAAKLSVWRAFLAAGISKSELARRMGLKESEVRRILDPNYGTKLDKLDAAARALGLRLVVRAEAA